jgi:hypothetical protein
MCREWLCQKTKTSCCYLTLEPVESERYGLQKKSVHIFFGYLHSHLRPSNSKLFREVVGEWEWLVQGFEAYPDNLSRSPDGCVVSSSRT